MASTVLFSSACEALTELIVMRSPTIAMAMLSGSGVLLGLSAMTGPGLTAVSRTSSDLTLTWLLQTVSFTSSCRHLQYFPPPVPTVASPCVPYERRAGRARSPWCSLSQGTRTPLS